MAGSDESKLSFTEAIKAYGGWCAFFKSGYMWVAAFLLLPTYSQWSHFGWWETVFSITPDMLGFTLGGFALTLAFGDDKFRGLLARAGANTGHAVLEEMAATFLIFITIQAMGLLAALVCQGAYDCPIFVILSPPWLHKILWGLSYFLFIYGIMLSLAAANWIFTLAMAYSLDLRSRPK